MNCEPTEHITFLETYKDLINIIVGIIGGIFLSTLTFLLTYRNNWRNRLTKELTVILKFNKKHTEGDKIAQLNLRYDINNTTGNSLSINSAYIELPKGLRGNVGPNSTLGEMLLETGCYYLFQESKEMTHNLSDELVINDPILLDELVKRKVKKLQLVVNTSRYGKVKSNMVKI